MNNNFIHPPTWLYKKINVPDQIKIQHELLAVSKFIIEDIDNLTPEFHYVSRDKIDDMIPVTKIFLDQLGILDRWKYLALITGNRGSTLPIHVDGTDWIHRSYGLNIPVLNCEDSFTVFYNAEFDAPFFDSTDPRASALSCKQDTAIEIDRVESSNPAWVNILIPHRPVINHLMPRILASFRFSPELHDILND
jgi:hypothetical protein